MDDAPLDAADFSPDSRGMADTKTPVEGGLRAPVPADRDPLIGKRFGNCVLRRKIGQGGMGLVYVAHHVGLNKPVAIKILSRELMGSDTNIQRFVREAQTAASLEHPNVVQVFDVGESEGTYYLAMQYVEGRSLDKVLEERRRIPAAEALEFARYIAIALGAAHKIGIVHRDIKPANVLINKEGVIKVADFGLARTVDSGQSLSMSGQMVGTPYYMSPEQAKAEKVDGRSDIYALGATLYHLVTGQPVFTGDTALSIVLKQIQEEPRPAHAVAPEVPPAVSQLIARMMAKSAAARFPDTDAVVKAIDAIKGGGGGGREKVVVQSVIGRRTKVSSGETGVSGGPEESALSLKIKERLRQRGQELPPPEPASAKPELPAGGETLLDMGVAPPATPAEEQAVAPAAMELPRENASGSPGGTLLDMSVPVVSPPPRPQTSKMAASRPIPEPEPARAPATPAAPKGDQPAVKLAHYGLINMIRSDEASVTWEADDLKRRRKVLVRFMRESEAQVAKRIYRLAGLGRELDHPNILKVWEAGTEQDEQGRMVHYMAYEQLDAPTSLDQLIAGGQWPVKKLMGVFAQVAEGIHHAHKKELFHESLNTMDVLVDSRDRAVAVFFDLNPKVAATGGEILPNEAFYLAPEQLPGYERKAEARTDVWHLGVMMYEAVTKRRPFDARTPTDLHQKILQEQPPAPGRFNSRVNGTLEGIILKAMEKDIELRYESAEALAQDLRRYLPDEAQNLQASAKNLPISRWGRFKRKLAKYKRVIILALSVLLLTGGSFGGYKVYQYRLFLQYKAEAMAAFEARDFTTALDRAGLALQIRADEELEEVQLESGVRIVENAVLDKMAEAYRGSYDKKADVRAQRNRLEAELKGLESATRDTRFSRDPGIRRVMGLGARQTGRFDDAESQLEAVLQTHPEDGPVRLALGQLQIEKYLTAMMLMDPVTGEGEIAGRAREWAAAAAHNLQHEVKPRREGLEEHLSRTFLALLEGEPRVRIAALCEEGLRKYPDKQGVEDCLNVLGWIAPTAEERARYGSQAIDRRPNHALPHVLRAEARVRRGELAEGVADYERAIALGPQRAAVHVLLGRAYQRQGETGKAIEEFTEALKRSPKFVDALISRATALRARNDEAGAKADLDQAFEASENYTWNFIHRARFRRTGNDLAGALQDIDRAITLDPKDPAPYIERGLAFRHQRRYEDALDSFGVAIRYGGSSPVAWVERAITRELKGDARNAIIDFNKALELAPQEWERRGEILKRLEALRRR